MAIKRKTSLLDNYDQAMITSNFMHYYNVFYAIFIKNLIINSSYHDFK